MSLDPTTLADVQAIEPADQFDMEWRDFLSNLPAESDNLERYLGVYCRTIRHKGKILGIGGVSTLWDHVGEMWFCASIHVKDHRLVTARQLPRLVGIARDVLNAHRLQVTVAPPNRRFGEFLEHIGFEKEGVLHSYIHPGEDYWLYYKLFPRIEEAA